MDSVLAFLSDVLTVVLGVHLYARGLDMWDKYKDKQ